MTLEDWKEKCSHMGYTAQEIADMSGVPIETVRAVIWGTEIPKFKLWEKLEKTLKEASKNMVREEALAYNYYTGRKSYTVEDYYAIPDGIRVELIDGQIYDMAAPLTIHQLLLVKLVTELENHIKKNKGKCILLAAPLDVQLDCDDKTMLQPDIFVTCDREKLHERNIYGAPDFVIEILSPSTRSRDAGLKMRKYKNAGVKEYWLVDPQKKRVVVYQFEHDIQKIYGFDMKVPVGIFDGKCEIDFKEIYEQIEFMYK